MAHVCAYGSIGGVKEGKAAGIFPSRLLTTMAFWTFGESDVQQTNNKKIKGLIVIIFETVASGNHGIFSPTRLLLSLFIDEGRSHWPPVVRKNPRNIFLEQWRARLLASPLKLKVIIKLLKVGCFLSFLSISGTIIVAQ